MCLVFCNDREEEFTLMVWQASVSSSQVAKEDKYQIVRAEKWRCW